ncbi:Hypothetical_protein [Hexamita inflata]|uniref:Hypothetical_protein n=1 Tax=Hexamita inflata TaxID=28002 RepID=A0AA86R2Y4_9EUKA|nr:Hypothetical protein HINF_LOCUS53681 [Hexamita inflata]
MEFISQISSYTDKNSKSMHSIQRKLSSASKLLNTPLDKRQLKTTNVKTNRSVPTELLNKEGEIISIESAFKYEFPDQIFDEDDEFIKLKSEQVNTYKDYVIQFTDLPEE